MSEFPECLLIVTVEVLEARDGGVALALDIRHRGLGDRLGEVERLGPPVGDDGRRQRDVVLAGGDAGQEARGPSLGR